LLHAAKAAQ